jgi:hypothetical protein
MLNFILRIPRKDTVQTCKKIYVTQRILQKHTDSFLFSVYVQFQSVYSIYTYKKNVIFIFVEGGKQKFAIFFQQLGQHGNKIFKGTVL